MASDPPVVPDPFAEIDGHRTFARPAPEGWPGARASGIADAPDTPASDLSLADHGLNPLLALANRLIVMVPQLRQTRQVVDPAALRASLAQGIRDFATSAQQRGVAPERIMAARYVLCTMIDEAAADTPWGGAGLWGRQSLLAEFHSESFGGEKVFQLMARLAEKPDINLDLLEFIYAALALGFEGRYRVIDGGRSQLEAIRAKLAQIIRQQRGAYPPALASNWQGRSVKDQRALSWLPLAVTACAALLALGGAYAAFAWSLSNRADPVYGEIQNLRLPAPLVPVAQVAPQPRLAIFLQPDIRAGMVAVRDEVDRSVITVRGDGLFAPASAALVTEREDLIRRIADALVRVGGEVVVTGHTDNTPMRSMRFPSNWHLSEERARTVQGLIIAAGVPADRVRAEGRADGEPLVPNDSAANRALNRRVEVMLLTARPEARPRRPDAPPAAAAAASR